MDTFKQFLGELTVPGESAPKPEDTWVSKAYKAHAKYKAEGKPDHTHPDFGGNRIKWSVYVHPLVGPGEKMHVFRHFSSRGYLGAGGSLSSFEHGNAWDAVERGTRTTEENFSFAKKDARGTEHRFTFTRHHENGDKWEHTTIRGYKPKVQWTGSTHADLDDYIKSNPKLP